MNNSFIMLALSIEYNTILIYLSGVSISTQPSPVRGPAGE